MHGETIDAAEAAHGVAVARRRRGSLIARGGVDGTMEGASPKANIWGAVPAPFTLLAGGALGTPVIDTVFARTSSSARKSTVRRAILGDLKTCV